MKLSDKYLYVGFSILIIMLSCIPNNSTNVSLAKERVLDPIDSIPNWLKFEVSKVLPSDSFNVWIPMGNIETSSLIRVPRFPTQLSGEKLEQNRFDLSRFKIDTLLSKPNLEISAVKNEQVSFQLAVASRQDISNLTVDISDFSSKRGKKISQENIEYRFVKYVPVQRARSELSWTGKPEEIYGPEVSGYGTPDIVADPLVKLKEIEVPAYRAQPIWFTIKVPKQTQSDTYHGVITIKTDRFKSKKIPLTIKIDSLQIPDPKDYKFVLDLWMNPKAIAEANNLEIWSNKYWELISKYIDDLASRGVKTINTTINQDPWLIDWLDNTQHSQTGIGYAPMIQWKLLRNNIWHYDYTIFDRYIELAFEKGLDKRIDVFSLTPFEYVDKENKSHRNIIYYDEALGKLIEKRYQQFDPEYKAHWVRFLKDFEKHLANKGWFKKTYLSFDESPKEVIESIVEMIKEGAPDFLNRLSVAGKPENSNLAQSLSIFYEHFSPIYNNNIPVEELLDERRLHDKTSTYYLCGAPNHPNTFTFSPAIESRMVPWIALKLNTDGYLRWAYNSWPNKDPFNNPVFNFIQGDDYYVYPGEKGPVSSIRWELLKEGIEDYELFELVKERGNLSDDMLSNVIEIATRNQDGRQKNCNEIIKAREVLLNEIH